MKLPSFLRRASKQNSQRTRSKKKQGLPKRLDDGKNIFLPSPYQSKRADRMQQKSPKTSHRKKQETPKRLDRNVISLPTPSRQLFSPRRKQQKPKKRSVTIRQQLNTIRKVPYGVKHRYNTQIW